MPRLKAHNVCSPFQNRNFSAALDSVDTDTACQHCLPDCSGTEYSASKSDAEFRWEADLALLCITDYCRQCSIIFAEYETSKRMTVFDLISNIGGLLGVCAGISIFSCEIIYWFILKMITR